MAGRTFAETLKRTRQDLDKLRRRRAAIDEQIAKLEQVELALSGLAEPKKRGADLTSVTDSVRIVLKSAREPITPTGVRDEMLAMGFDKKPYSQFLATVHVILKRLWRNNEALEFSFKDGKRYWWATKSMPGGPYPENAMLLNYYNSFKAEDLQSSLTYEQAKAKEAAKYRR